MKTKQKRRAKVGNLDLALAMHAKRGTAAGAHDSRPNRQRTRRDVKRHAIREFS